jgi:hypothetical protein
MLERHEEILYKGREKIRDTYRSKKKKKINK